MSNSHFYSPNAFLHIQPFWFYTWTHSYSTLVFNSLYLCYNTCQSLTWDFCSIKLKLTSKRRSRKEHKFLQVTKVGIKTPNVNLSGAGGEVGGGSTTVGEVHCVGSLNGCTKFHGNTHNSCWDISTQTKAHTHKDIQFHRTTYFLIFLLVHFLPHYFESPPVSHTCSTTHSFIPFSLPGCLSHRCGLRLQGPAAAARHIPGVRDQVRLHREDQWPPRRGDGYLQRRCESQEKKETTPSSPNAAFWLFLSAAE